MWQLQLWSQSWNEVHAHNTIMKENIYWAWREFNLPLKSPEMSHFTRILACTRLDRRS